MDYCTHSHQFSLPSNQSLCWGSSSHSPWWGQCRRTLLGWWDGLKRRHYLFSEAAQMDAASAQMWRIKVTHLFGCYSPCGGVRSLQPCTEAGRMGGAGSCWREGAARAVWVSAGGQTFTYGSSATPAWSCAVYCRRSKFGAKVIENSRINVLHCSSLLTFLFRFVAWRDSRVSSTTHVGDKRHEESKVNSREHVEAATYLVVKSSR